MPVKSETYEQVCVVTLNDDFAGDDVAAARRVVDRAVEDQNIVDVVLDVRKVPFVDSEGLEALLWMQRRCEEVFGQIKLVGPDENFRKILEMVRLDHRLECHDTVESAVKTLR